MFEIYDRPTRNVVEFVDSESAALAFLSDCDPDYLNRLALLRDQDGGFDVVAEGTALSGMVEGYRRARESTAIVGESTSRVSVTVAQISGSGTSARLSFGPLRSNLHFVRQPAKKWVSATAGTPG